MAHDLEEHHERLAWCRQKTDGLRQQIVDSSKLLIKGRIVLQQPGTGDIRAMIESQPTAGLRTEVGAIVHEQRAILDALACTLATRNGVNDATDVYFPIMRDEQAFKEQGLRKIKRLNAADQKTIVDLKPWQANQPTLFQMHEADRIRKHQRLLKWAFFGQAWPVGPGHVGMMVATPTVIFEIGKEEQIAFFRDANAKFEVLFSAVYGEAGPLNGLDVERGLHEFSDEVERMLSLFA